jgi:hypothetical protein
MSWDDYNNETETQEIAEPVLVAPDANALRAEIISELSGKIEAEMKDVRASLAWQAETQSNLQSFYQQNPELAKHEAYLGVEVNNVVAEAQAKGETISPQAVLQLAGERLRENMGIKKPVSPTSQFHQLLDVGGSDAGKSKTMSDVEQAQAILRMDVDQFNEFCDKLAS